MNDNENVNIDTTNDGVEELDLTLDDSNEDIEALKEQNKRLFERAKKAEAKLKVAKPITNNEKPLKYDIPDEVLDLRLEGYTKSEVEFIMNNGGRKALEDSNSLVAIAIKTQKEQRQAEIASSKTADTSSLSEVERKYTPEQLKNMSASELEKILPRA